MKLIKSILIGCKEAGMLSTRRNEEALSTMEKFTLYFHELFCPPCRFFSRQVRSIHDSLKRISQQSHVSFTAEKKEELQKKINSLV